MEYLVVLKNDTTLTVKDVERIEIDEYGVQFVDKNFTALLFVTHSQLSHLLKA